MWYYFLTSCSYFTDEQFVCTKVQQRKSMHNVKKLENPNHNDKRKSYSLVCIENKIYNMRMQNAILG